MHKVRRTDLGWRGNKATFRVTFNSPGGGGNDDPVIPLTDSRTRTYTAGSTDTGNEISRFFREFVIQRTDDANLANITIQINAGGGWVTCPDGCIPAATNGTKAVLRASEADLAHVKLPPGCQLRLSITNIAAAATGDIFVSMSDSLEKPDISRS